MCQLRFKKGVKVVGIRPEMALFLLTATGVAHAMGLQELWVTSGVEGTHRKGSLHYIGHGLDLRTRESTGRLKRWTPKFTEMFATKLRQGLTSEYDVVVEKNHIHGEFQPKSQV